MGMDADPMSMARDLLMPSQRLMLSMLHMPHMLMDTHMLMDGYGLGGVAAHPGFATSFTQRSPQGLRGKRSADAEPLLAYDPYAPFVPVTGSTYGYGPSGYGISQGHPGAAVSHQFVSRL